MPNITLNVDEKTLKKARKIAVDKNTTLTEMIREFLESLAKRDTLDRDRAVKALDQSFKKYSRRMGPRSWTRDSLYERLPVQEIDLPVVKRAIDNHRRYGISYWDSLILAAAERAGCGEVHSEDLQDGQVYNRVRVVNPFKS